MKSVPIGVLFAGVGGQGILLASELLSEAALAAGLDVKKSEVHGMAQRGGSVISHVRFGAQVHSPLIPEGEADFLVSFEEMESLRHLPLLKKGGVLIVNLQRIYTLAMLLGKELYPDAALAGLEELPISVTRLDGLECARRAGNPRTANIVLLGALASHLPFDAGLWFSVLEKRVPPKYLEVNKASFRMGLECGCGEKGNLNNT